MAVCLLNLNYEKLLYLINQTNKKMTNKQLKGFILLHIWMIEDFEEGEGKLEKITGIKIPRKTFYKKGYINISQISLFYEDDKKTYIELLSNPNAVEIEESMEDIVNLIQQQNVQTN